MEWLSSKGVTYPDKCFKSELWEIAKRNKTKNEVASEAGKAKPHKIEKEFDLY